MARHWHDVYTLDRAGHAEPALENRAIADAVARHKGWFFPSKDASGNPVDYAAAVNGGLCLVPEGATLGALAADYNRMVADGLLLDDAQPFSELIEGCCAIQDHANGKQSQAIAAVSKEELLRSTRRQTHPYPIRIEPIAIRYSSAQCRPPRHRRPRSRHRGPRDCGDSTRLRQGWSAVSVTSSPLSDTAVKCKLLVHG